MNKVFSNVSSGVNWISVKPNFSSVLPLKVTVSAKCSQKRQMHSFESGGARMTAKLFWVLRHYITLEWTAGSELVQSVSLLSGQGQSLTAREEPDPLTVNHCCIYPENITWKLINAGDDEEELQQDTAQIHEALLCERRSQLVQFYEELRWFFFSLPVSGTFNVSASVDPQNLMLYRGSDTNERGRNLSACVGSSRKSSGKCLSERMYR